MAHLLEQYRALYQKSEERQNRHYFRWSTKKTESAEETFIDEEPAGIFLSSGRIIETAAKDLAEGIEMWLNPPKRCIPEGALGTTKVWGPFYGW